MERSMLSVGDQQLSAADDNMNNQQPHPATHSVPRLKISIPKKQEQLTPTEGCGEATTKTTTTMNDTSSSSSMFGCLTSSANISPTPAKFRSSSASMFEHQAGGTTQVNGSKQYVDEWPTNSATALPSLSETLITGLENHNLNLPINEECTSLTLVPSGRHVVAGFTDGTLRIFDLTGRFAPTDHTLTTTNEKSMGNNSSRTTSTSDGEFDEDDDDEVCFDEGTTIVSEMHTPTDPLPPLRNKSRNYEVASNQHQRFGAVAFQIHARGVHTSLLMDVDVAQDGMYCFGGVLRGSMELVAVRLKDLEDYHQRQDATNNHTNVKHSSNTNTKSNQINLLDLITVHRHSDAKLRGFGACTRIRNYDQHGSPKYLLFTGKAIKNIHIWSFEPHDSTHEDATWQCLYDTQTNGNTITHLHFRYDPHGLLQGISKSDGQKLRVWDLSFEQHLGDTHHPCYHKNATTTRSKRPSFCDVTSTEAALGVCGSFCLCGGAEFYNHISIVSLDVENLKSPFNHTELALPEPSMAGASGSGGGGGNSQMHGRAPPRRQQRGDLKSVVSVTGMTTDASHILLELSDRSMIHYRQGGAAGNGNTFGGHPNLETLSSSYFSALAEGVVRKTCVARVGAEGVVLAAVANYNPNWGRGSITLHPIEFVKSSTATAPAKEGFWGFLPSLAPTTSRGGSPSLTDRHAIAACCYVSDFSTSKDANSQEFEATSKLEESITAEPNDNVVNFDRNPQHVIDNTPMPKGNAKVTTSSTNSLLGATHQLAARGTQVSPESSEMPPSNGPAHAMRKEGELMRYFGRRLPIDRKSDVKGQTKGNSRNDEHQMLSPIIPRKTTTPRLEEVSKSSLTPNEKRYTQHEQQGSDLSTAKPSPAVPRKKPRPVADSYSNLSLLASVLEHQESYLPTTKPSPAIPRKVPKPSVDLDSNSSLLAGLLEGTKGSTHANHADQASRATLAIVPVLAAKTPLEESLSTDFLDNTRNEVCLLAEGSYPTATLQGTEVHSGEMLPQTQPRSSTESVSHLAKDIACEKPGEDQGPSAVPFDIHQPYTESPLKSSLLSPLPGVTREQEEPMQNVLNAVEPTISVPRKLPRPSCEPSTTPSKSVRTGLINDDLTMEDHKKRKLSPAVPRKIPRQTLQQTSTSPRALVHVTKIHHDQGEPRHRGKPPQAVPRKSSRSSTETTSRPPKSTDTTTKSNKRALDTQQGSSSNSETSIGTGTVSTVRDRFQKKTPKRAFQSAPVENRTETLPNVVALVLPFKRIRLLLEEIPKSSVASRFSAFLPRAETLAASHEAARMNLAAHHRASHEMLRRKVINAADGHLRSLSTSSLATVSMYRASLDECLREYQEMLSDMLFRQEMEACTLAAKQTVELHGIPAPTLAVSFPFPEIFDAVRSCVDDAIHELHRASRSKLDV